ncbi:MAG: aromatic ring-hydroxylating dioxygenase subunit alpha [Alphaproteobacteria bacterium]|nr:aromatic ring-hydroxylating dioxygenase subunit alpha [Alphaproteobacteria bacterium]
MGDLLALIERQRAGWTLEADFYLDAGVAAAENDAIWHRRWLFAAHGCELAVTGAFVTLSIAGEPVVVVRGRDGVARAFANVCRHRGSRICTAASGRVHRLVCPYHAWSYDLDGRLLSDVSGHGGQAETLGLRPYATHEVGGLVFVSLADRPEDIAPLDRAFAPQLAPQGLTRARIAARASYRVEANWKVVFENNRECFHCPVAHREYIRANYDVHLTDPRRAEEIDARTAAEAKRWAELGLGAPSLVSDMTSEWYRINRTPLVPGFVTESLDGKPVAPVMGDYPEHDVGTLRVTVFPNFWMHGSGDHAVTTRLLPDGTGATRVDVAWLVDAAAEEGRDYRVEALQPFWQLTSEQDWTICENVQAGLRSRAYAPGPLERVKERNVAQFIAWYLGLMRANRA